MIGPTHDCDKRRQRRRGVVVALCTAAFALAVAGCGGSGSTVSTGPGTTSSAASTPTTAPPSRHATAKPPTSSAPPSSSAPTSSHPTEFSPPGDIPDNQVFVPYTAPGGLVKIKVPEGWARSSHGGAVTFTDKLNSITIQVVPLAQAPTKTWVRNHEVPQLAASQPMFALKSIETTTRSAGPVVLTKYERDSKPDPVTGKVIRDVVEQYDFWKGGNEAVLSLSGPVGADNVDPWQLVSDSLTWK
jgi:hypothetical protein